MSINNLTPSQLRQAASIIEEIEKLQNQLNELQGSPAPAPAPVAVAADPEPVAVETNGEPARKRRKMSAAGLARIRAAQKLRWAKVHATQGR